MECFIDIVIVYLLLWKYVVDLLLLGGELYVKYYLGKYLYIKFKKNVKKLIVFLNSRVIGYFNFFSFICIFNYFFIIS